MFDPGELSVGRRRRKPVRYHDCSEAMAPRTTRDKRTAASRLNLSNDKNRSLSSLEEDFIYAAEFGDIPTVRRVLEEHINFSVDYSDILGRSPLRLAVGNEHLEVVELLLDRCNISTIHEALLQAISAGHEQIAETILKHPKYQNIKKENKRFGETDYFYTTTSEDSPFSSDITPLILAAERNQFEIVQLLLLRGETIPKPHHYYCSCQECANKLEFDQLRLAKTRLNAYKGLASGAYISLSSKDPILTAFELARELRQVAKVEKYYKTDYLALADQLSDYVVKLLDKIRGHDELQILINKTGSNSEQETYELLARLKLAIRYREKKFVAHPSCQQKLVNIWYANLRTLERSNWFKRGIIVILITLFYPILAICYWFAPNTKIGEFLRCPSVKFIGQTMSFITFLLMILISAAMEQSSAHKKLSSFPRVYKNYEMFQNRTSNWPDDFVIRTFQPETIHVLMSIWIVGMIWQEVKQLYSEGLFNYFDSLYNYLDTAVLTLYVTSFTLRYITIVKVNLYLKRCENQEYWEAMVTKTYENQLRDIYWLIADRLYWNGYDPYNIAEALFALANIISFARVSFVLPANELFGPMQISLARMITDILKFGIIFLVLFLAFIVGLYNLYWYYPKTVRGTVELRPNNVTTEAEKFFGIPDVTFRTVFWSMLGRGETTVVELGEYNNYFTQNVGYWIFGVYNVAIVIVLLNMLIAMMSRSFEIIEAEADTEWKFARTKLYMEYISGDSTLPVPFNIVPSPKSIVALFKQTCALLCRKEEQPPLGHPGRIKDIEMFSSNGNHESAIQPGWEAPGSRNQGIKQFRERMATTNGFVRNDSDPNLYNGQTLTYKRVMKRVVKRYIFDMQRETDTKDADIEELKQDISSFRYEMLNQLNMHHQASEQSTIRLDQMASRLDEISRLQEQLLNSIHRTGSVWDSTRKYGSGGGSDGGGSGEDQPRHNPETDSDGSCDNSHQPLRKSSKTYDDYQSSSEWAVEDTEAGAEVTLEYPSDLSHAAALRSARKRASIKLRDIPEEGLSTRAVVRESQSVKFRSPLKGAERQIAKRRSSEPTGSVLTLSMAPRSPVEVQVEFCRPGSSEFARDGEQYPRTRESKDNATETDDNYYKGQRL